MEKRGMNISAYSVLIICIAAIASAQRSTGDRCTDSRGRNGVCTDQNHCSSAQQDMREGVTPTNCGIDRGQPIVCCVAGSPTSAASPKLSASPATERKLGSKAKTWCTEYSKPCPQSLGIAGGTPALPDEFPHMAAIGYGAENDIQWLCGGALISDKFVLTAAHCLGSTHYEPPEWVLLGAVKLAANESSLGNTGQIHRVIRRIRHPGYQPPAKYDNVGLLEIGPAITRNPRPLTIKELHPACLRTDDSTTFDNYIVTGWGGFGPGEDGNLEHSIVDSFDEAKCNETFDFVIRTTNQLRRGIVSTMMCAGMLPDGNDTSPIRSGGPLQYATLGTCQYEIWGITSFGRFSGLPAVYTKVSAYTEWIEDNVWPN